MNQNDAKSRDEQARLRDDEMDAQLIRQSVTTLQLAGKQSAILENIHQNPITTIEAIKNLEGNKMEDPQHSALNEARAELIEALRNYHGEFPSVGIDSSELTVRFTGEPYYTGEHSQIYKGYRNGQLVAIKRLFTDRPEDVALVCGVRPSAFVFEFHHYFISL